MHPSAFQRVATPRSAMASLPATDDFPSQYQTRPLTAQGVTSSMQHTEQIATSRDDALTGPGRPGSASFADVTAGRRSASPRLDTELDATATLPAVAQVVLIPGDHGAPETELAPASAPTPAAGLGPAPTPVPAEDGWVQPSPNPETVDPSYRNHPATSPQILPGPALPTHLHPSADVDWDARDESSWNQPNFQTSLRWDDGVGQHFPARDQRVAAGSDDGSYGAPSLDEAIRNLPPSLEASFFDPPAVVMARMMDEVPQGPPLAAPTPQLQHPVPIRPSAPAPMPTLPDDTSTFAAPWARHPEQTNSFEQHSYNTFHASLRQTGPEILVDVTTNVHPPHPTPKPPFTPTGAPEGTAGPSRLPEAPSTPRHASHRDDRALSRASVLSYVAIQRGTQPAPIDVDAMDVDEAPPAPAGQPAYQAHAPQRPAPAPAAAPHRAAARPIFHHPLLDDQNIIAGPLAPSGIDWLNADYTRAPPDGWKTIQFLSLRDVLKGQDPQQAKRWREIARLHRCVLVQIAACGAGNNDPAGWQRVTLLKEMCLVLLGVGRHQFLGPQAEDGAPSGDNVPPYFILIKDLTPVQQATMLGWVWKSSKWLSANFIPFPTPLPTYLATWEGATAFASLGPEDVEDMLAAGFQRDPLLSATVRAITNDKQSGAAGKWGDTPTAHAFHSTVNSIRVRVLGRLWGRDNDLAPLYVMYCDPPTADPREWEDFRDVVRAHSFGVDGGRSPDLFRDDVECRICHSADHSVGLCDLDEVEGWNGPRRDLFSTTPPKEPRGNKGKQRGGKQPSQGRGGRGRGRGGRGGRGGGGGRAASGQSLDPATKAALLRSARGNGRR
ncbi:uncharacterized protein C8Q71DRAFT_724410 [Rhodofomes roseus]|uniref:Uncharacterized protein n=1 Tax=Rhodofomes roseus TaxID=34475 RepID=A0ABQ8KE58_9APHY|nr:uncharacterized protein C8Q71DRAFT_724410 [Rhodofomes roseus]KAH9835832.1 hypothetical protein C8Q71DRAFT_724410 [Rhodofomes roseus]